LTARQSNEISDWNHVLRDEAFMMEPVREIRLSIPKPVLEILAQEPRIVLKPAPGLWPIDAKLLKSGLLEKLAADREFQEQYEVMIMPRM
jgi:hypothetical protein